MVRAWMPKWLRERREIKERVQAQQRARLAAQAGPAAQRSLSLGSAAGTRRARRDDAGVDAGTFATVFGVSGDAPSGSDLSSCGDGGGGSDSGGGCGGSGE